MTKNAALGGALPETIDDRTGHSIIKPAVPHLATELSRQAPWGPWSPGLTDDVERKCQLRGLACVIAAYRGSASPLIDVLRAAESDAEALRDAAVVFDGLPSLVARRIVSTFGAVNFRGGAP
jgi:hypothetical protein